MPDVFTKAKRSAVMSLIRSYGNRATELALTKIMRAQGLTGWRRRQPLFGKPDFVFRSRKVALFVDGCFWHGCPIHGTQPAGNRAFWKKKLNRNRERDVTVKRELRRRGWRVFRIWEHELARKRRARLVRRLFRIIRPD